MPSSIKVIESIENDLEVTEPRNAELGVFDVGVMRDNLNVRIEPLCSLLGNLPHQLALRKPTDL